MSVRYAPVVALAFLMVAIPVAAAEAAGAPDPQAAVSEGEAGAAGAGSDQPIEEMTVVGTRIKLTAAERKKVYQDLAKARRLYSQNQIKQAFPYLLRTAEQGFKDSQAKVGHIYLQGLGQVERDSEQAVGWLGAASSGTTTMKIRNYFMDVWERIPEPYVPYFEEVVEEYKSRYGERTTGVVCEMRRPLRSHVKQLGCYFEEDLPDRVRDGLDDFRSREEAAMLEQERMREVQRTIEQMRRSGLTR